MAAFVKIAESSGRVATERWVGYCEGCLDHLVDLVAIVDPEGDRSGGMVCRCGRVHGSGFSVLLPRLSVAEDGRCPCGTTLARNTTEVKGTGLVQCDFCGRVHRPLED